jgi:hypothetical protein
MISPNGHDYHIIYMIISDAKIIKGKNCVAETPYENEGPP